MAKIEGGATIWARQTVESEIFADKPDKWFKIWFYLISRVNHKDNQRLRRGQALIKYEWIEESTGATKHQIDHFIRWAKNTKKGPMLATQKATRGMVVTILNYDYFQNLDNYKSDTESEMKATQKRHRSDTINKNDKNENNEKNKKDTLLPEWLSVSLWERFINHRKAVKAPIQKDSWDSFIKKFVKLKEQGWEPETVIDTMIEKGWRWFKPEWMKEGGNGRSNASGSTRQAPRKEGFAGKNYQGTPIEDIDWAKDDDMP